MAQRRHHYEAAFEEYLRAHRIPYVAVDEARKALMPGDGPGQLALGLKSFDFVLYGPGENLLVEIKGRRIAARSGRLECWVTEEDIQSLTAWERLFGDGFRAAFVFLYWCDEQPSAPLFEDIFEFRANWYAVRVVELGPYAAAMRPRSPRWGTVHLSAADFERLSRPLAGLGPRPADLYTPALPH